ETRHVKNALNSSPPMLVRSRFPADLAARRLGGRWPALTGIEGASAWWWSFRRAPMENEKDRFGETMRLVERAREVIYFAERDRELLENLRRQLRRVEKTEESRCPKCTGKLEAYTFRACRCISD